MKDTQRQRVYQAERATKVWRETVGFVHAWRAKKDGLESVPGRFATLEQVAAYARSVVASPFWKRTAVLRYAGMDRRALEVTEQTRARGSSWAKAWNNEISMHREHWCELVVLHELAHLGTANRPRSEGAHGREFARLYLQLVKHYLGVAAYRDLLAQMRARNVKHTRAASLTDEQREAKRQAFLAAKPRLLVMGAEKKARFFEARGNQVMAHLYRQKAEELRRAAVAQGALPGEEAPPQISQIGA